MKFRNGPQFDPKSPKDSPATVPPTAAPPSGIRGEARFAGTGTYTPPRSPSMVSRCESGNKETE